jgi:hypothetical protein
MMVAMVDMHSLPLPSCIRVMSLMRHAQSIKPEDMTTVLHAHQSTFARTANQRKIALFQTAIKFTMLMNTLKLQEKTQ